MKIRMGWVAGALALLLLWLLGASLYTLEETQMALIIRLGAPAGMVTTPGLQFKMPFTDSVVVFDKRLRSLVPPVEQIILGDQKRVEVETYARYRIQNLLRFYQSVRSQEQADVQLSQLVSSSLRRELGQVALPVLLSAQRDRVVVRIQKDVAERAASLGIEVTEVRLHRADLPLETSQAIYERMKSERQREAKELRAQGFEWAQQIQAKAERDRTVLLSEAQRQAAIVRGEADAAANQTLSAAFSQDAQFYRLYRALQTYRGPLADARPTLLLTPDSEFMKRFRSGPTTGGQDRP